MNLIASVVLSVSLQQVIVLPSCCPVLTWVAVRVVPVVVVTPAPMPSAAGHAARI